MSVVNKQSLAGAVKSKTVYVGLATLVFTYLSSGPDGFEPLISAEHVAAFAKIGLYVSGLATIVARFLTDNSLADKGAE